MAAGIVKIDLVVIAALTIGVTTLIVDFTVDRAAGLIALVASLVAIGLLSLVLPRLVRRAVGRS